MEDRCYYISDTAYDNLVKQATAANFHTFGIDRAVGVSKYLRYIAQQPNENWHDNRPVAVRNTDVIRIATKKQIYWNSEERRWKRSLVLDEITLNNLQLIALRLSIKNHKPHRYTRRAAAAAVIEALGLNWLVVKGQIN